mmetsp:Transcript_2029/g.2973  ORF Transcript_2029/g.2973 Transcript_2029/m.2973 type:complete len:232 (-) Transcript_2029:26-721(-)
MLPSQAAHMHFRESNHAKQVHSSRQISANRGTFSTFAADNRVKIAVSTSHLYTVAVSMHCHLLLPTADNLGGILAMFWSDQLVCKRFGRRNNPDVCRPLESTTFVRHMEKHYSKILRQRKIHIQEHVLHQISEDYRAYVRQNWKEKMLDTKYNPLCAASGAAGHRSQIPYCDIPAYCVCVYPLRSNSLSQAHWLQCSIASTDHANSSPVDMDGRSDSHYQRILLLASTDPL